MGMDVLKNKNKNKFSFNVVVNYIVCNVLLYISVTKDHDMTPVFNVQRNCSLVW